MGGFHRSTPSPPRTTKSPIIDPDHPKRSYPRSHRVLYPHPVPTGLKRYQTAGDDHLITFSCYHRLPYLSDDRARSLFERTVEG